MTTPVELWDKLRQQPNSWLPTGRVWAFVLTPNERETVLSALRGEGECAAQRVLKIIAEMTVTEHGQFIPNAAAVMKQMAKNVIESRDDTDGSIK